MRLGPCLRRAATTLACALTACQPAFNYLDPEGPRYAGIGALAPPPFDGGMTVVTFNVRYAEDVDGALEELRDANLLDADVYLLQEMDAPGTERLATALGAWWVYYPASIHGDRDFGNAVLSRWPILEDRKVLLPGEAPFDGRRRIAVVTRIDGPRGEVFAVSVHDETLLAGEATQRAQTLAILADLAANEAGAGLVAGDFNAASDRLRAWTEAAFEDHGFTHVGPPSGAGTASSPLGALPLDHVFARGFTALDARVVPSRGASDHHAVAVTLAAEEARP